MQTDEFEIPNATMEEIKYRVKSWLSSYEGNKYYMEVIHERHVKIAKTKQDPKICVYGCCTYFLTTILGMFILIGLITHGSYIDAFMTIMQFMTVMVMIIPLFLAWFCLRPNKVEFDVRFSFEQPIKIMIIASGNMFQNSIHEYQSFLQALNPSSMDSGIGLSF